jgi:hypothetical protein
MNSRTDRLSRPEINLLKHLATFSPIGIPITVPRKFVSALVPLWRLALIEIWYRQDRDNVGGRRTQFVSITIDGARRIDAILHSRNSWRLAGSLGQGGINDQSSEPEQGEQGHTTPDHPGGRPENTEDD